MKSAHVPDAVYQLFGEAKLLPNKERLWEQSKQHILDQPKLAPEVEASLAKLTAEIEHRFGKFVKPGSLVYRKLPAGNTQVIHPFIDVYVVDSNMLLNMDTVHGLLAEDSNLDCQSSHGCGCQRKLLFFGMVKAVSCQGKQSTEKVLQHLTYDWLTSSSYELDCTQHAAKPSSAPPEAQQQQQTVPTVNIVYKGNGPVDPKAADPAAFHEQIQLAIKAVMEPASTHSHGIPVLPGCKHSSSGPSPLDITVELCTRKQTDDLFMSSIMLSPGSANNLPQYLYLPREYDMGSWSPGKTVHAQKFHGLIGDLHSLFADDHAPVHVYYDPQDNCFAFNQANVLWYNAWADCVYGNTLPAMRRRKWYLIVCHEAAHAISAEHNERFATAMGHIAMARCEAFLDFDKAASADEVDSSN